MSREFKASEVPVVALGQLLKKDIVVEFLDFGPIVTTGIPARDVERCGKQKNHVALKLDFSAPVGINLDVPKYEGARVAMDAHWSSSVGSTDAQYAGSNESDNEVPTVPGKLNVKFQSYPGPSTGAILEVAQGIGNFKFVLKGIASMGCRHYMLCLLYELVKAGLAQPNIEEIVGDYTDPLKWRYSRTVVGSNSLAGMESGRRLNPLPIDKAIFESYQPPNFPRVTFAQT